MPSTTMREPFPGKADRQRIERATADLFNELEYAVHRLPDCRTYDAGEEGDEREITAADIAEAAHAYACLLEKLRFGLEYLVNERGNQEVRCAR